MGNYYIGASVATLFPVTGLTSDGADPHPSQFVEYAEVVGTDLNGAPIEAGLPRCTWNWSEMDAAGFDALTDYFTTNAGIVYIQTRTNVYASDAYTFATYKARMARPRGETVPGKRYSGVTIEFTMMELQS